MSGRAPDVYWRRRVFALTGAIGALVLIAWTINGALGGAGNAQQAADTTHTGHHHHSGLAAAATTPAAGPAGTATATPMPTPTATATPRPTGSAGAKHNQAKHAQAKHSQNKAKQDAAGKGSAGACPRGAVVLSLFTTKYHYPGHQVPRFQLDVVSTAGRPCSFDVGAKNVQLVIKAGGERRVWDSAACLGSRGHRTVQLARGVPVVLQVSWDRKTAGASCRQPGPAAQPGTYTAIVRSGRLHSQSLIFVLGGRNVTVP
jgi:hypothetical protein